MVREGRLLLVTVLLVATAAYLAAARSAEPVAARRPLDSCPMTIADWRGVRGTAFDPRTLSVLRVDDYINRVYEDDRQRPVALYVGYYGSQREGATMHSPLNCLPGAGWSPVSFRRMDIPVDAGTTNPDAPRTGATRAIRVNRYVIEKGLNRQVVLYWYQAHGRVVASEYWGKIYLVADAIRTNRTDGALVRIVAPVMTTEGEAEARAVGFARAVFAELERVLS